MFWREQVIGRLRRHLDKHLVDRIGWLRAAVGVRGIAPDARSGVKSGVTERREDVIPLLISATAMRH